MKKKIKKNLFGFILGAILVSSITVYAASAIQASKLSVDTTNMSNFGSNKTVQDSIEYLYSKSKTYCPSIYKCYKTHNTLQVGDYVKMTPTSTSFKTDTSKTGYTGIQTINPSELNLWRVIKVNGDGTIEMVSEYVSSTAVYFNGQVGYKNLIGYLNVLASQYTNTKYVKSTRYMGYNEQTEYITNTSALTSTTAPWTCFTGASGCNVIESKGGGDNLYTTDTDLVKKTIGTLKAYTPTMSPSDYWLASRYYYYSSSTMWEYSGRCIISSGGINNQYLYSYFKGYKNYSFSAHLRPIVILKSEISYIPALGTIEDPFILS